MVKGFTVECAQDEVEFYKGMVAEGQQSFKGLIEHLQDVFQSGQMVSKLISNFYGQSLKTLETKDAFADDFQVLAKKIIVWKPSFHLDPNHQLKAKYAHKLWDPYYMAMAFSVLQSSPEEGTFTRFQGCLVTMFGGHAKQSKSSVASVGMEAELSQIWSKWLKNSRQQQIKIDKQEAKINSLQNQINK